MKYLLLLFLLHFLTACSSYNSNIGDKGLEIDIYSNEMTFEKFKQTLINYADNSTYPSLTST